MNNIRERLDELATWPASPDQDWSRVLERGARRRTRRRASVAVVALVLAGAAVGLAAKAFNLPPSGTGTVMGPQTVHDLRLAWAASVGPNASGPVIGERELLVGTSRGSVLAFRTSCPGRRCLPAWFGSSGVFKANVAASRGIVVVAAQAVSAFPARCANGGRACTPLWTNQTTLSGHTFSQPTISDGVVYVGAPDGRVLAYDLACRSDGGACRPLWIGRTGHSAAVSRPAVEAGMVFVMSDRLYAFRVGCNEHGGSCSAAWSASVGTVSSSSGPAAGAGTVIVASDKAYAFGAACTPKAGTCSPRWTYAPPEHLPLTGPVIDRDRVYVGGTRVRALALRCGSNGSVCSPTWQGPTANGAAFSAPTVARGLVFSSTNRPYAFDEQCPATCRPIWVGPILGFGVSTPAVDRDGLFVTTSDGDLFAFRIGRASRG
jgi:outer membrane protein assembly factor BamB